MKDWCQQLCRYEKWTLHYGNSASVPVKIIAIRQRYKQVVVSSGSTGVIHKFQLYIFMNYCGRQVFIIALSVSLNYIINFPEFIFAYCNDIERGYYNN